MALKNPFKLEKLKINVYTTSKRSGKPKDRFEAMFNPSTLSMRYENVYESSQGLNTSGRRQIYSHSRSDELQLDLILDGTGVTDSGITSLAGGGSKSVPKQVKKFLDLCANMDGKLHEPKYLNIEWGILDFDCRLQSVDITYTSFDKNGMPLRAELAAVFVEDLDPNKRARKENKSSPDLSHVHIVKSGDTLPLLSKSIYGDAAHYLRLAEANDLDDFRNLTPGQELRFPPLAT